MWDIAPTINKGKAFIAAVTIVGVVALLAEDVDQFAVVFRGEDVSIVAGLADPIDP